MTNFPRPVALVTGVGRRIGIGAAIAERLAATGWDVGFTSWRAYARASWLLIREFALRFNRPYGTGRIFALTSDHTVRNMPYGASKAALDRITIAAARELGHLGVTANVINPGPVDTGWMSEEVAARCLAATPLGRLGKPADCAHLVGFLCSPEGGWINGQLIHSNGGSA